MKKQIKIYSKNIEQSALDQFNSAMDQEFSVKGALMPDSHTGYSLPIGAVVATNGVILPSWVGYDIGCGMCAVKTTFNNEDIKEYSKFIFDGIYRSVPTGFSMQKEKVKSNLDEKKLSLIGFESFNKRGGFQALGTLGGGNHFIEIGEDEDSNIWIIIHSGSRGVGHGIAGEYMKRASNSDKAKDGHYGFDVKSGLGEMYINDMNWCLDFALENRKTMMSEIVKVIERKCEGVADFENLINRNHNHAEEKDGLWIHRKGATHAEKGMMGVIPGNMKDGSFIVNGKGNPDSLFSSSHGAGRVFSRKKARETLSMEDFKTSMEGITAKVKESTLDESKGAYKNIFDVMDLQKDLVEVVAYVKPIINIKG